MKSQPRTFVIIGATSAIATAVARTWAERGATFFLVARNEDKVRAVASDLLARGAERVSVFVADLLRREIHADIVRRAQEELGSVDCVIVAHGTLVDQTTLDVDVDAMIDNFMTNAVSVLAITHRFAQLLEGQGAGIIVGLSSVAGERGRRTNYVYGAAKAAMTSYLSGLRSRLLRHGVAVVTVKPGPVATPMTDGVNLPLKADVSVVATDITRAIEKRTAEVYTPAVWRFIMFALRSIPERIFMRLKV
jgi:short-subunit dehydrogenase